VEMIPRRLEAGSGIPGASASVGSIVWIDGLFIDNERARN
jgi:hypothetical protein